MSNVLFMLFFLSFMNLSVISLFVALAFFVNVGDFI